MRGIAAALFIMVFVALIPTVLAWRAWYKTDRLRLARWRNVTGVISLATTAFVWGGVAILTPLLWLILPAHLSMIWAWVALRPLSLLALPCAFALKGYSRWLALASAVVTQYFFSIVFHSDV